MFQVGTTSSNLTLGSSGEGAFSLVKTGNGSLALGGTNAYTGGTTVLAGTLELLSSSALPSTGILTIGSPREVVLSSSGSDGAMIYITGGSVSTLLAASPPLLEGESPPQVSGVCMNATARSTSSVTAGINSVTPSLADAILGEDRYSVAT